MRSLHVSDRVTLGQNLEVLIVVVVVLAWKDLLLHALWLLFLHLFLVLVWFATLIWFSNWVIEYLILLFNMGLEMI